MLLLIIFHYMFELELFFGLEKVMRGTTQILFFDDWLMFLVLKYMLKQLNVFSAFFYIGFTIQSKLLIFQAMKFLL